MTTKPRRTTRRPYTAPEIARQIEVLVASARESSTGVPNWTACARELGADRTTLRRRWAEVPAETPQREGATPTAKPVTDADDHIAWAMALLGYKEEAPIVRHLAWVRARVDRMTGETAIVGGVKEIRALISEHAQPSGGGGALTPDEFVEQVVASPALLRRAFLRSPDLHADPEIVAAVDAAREEG